MREDFGVFILTHGRAGRVYTVDSLKKAGYTGRLYFVIDNEDDQADSYRHIYGAENVIVFDKEAEMQRCDTMDNFGKKGVILFARNACFDIAKTLGLKYFLELDDDYTGFYFRHADKNKLAAVECKQLDRLFEDMLDFLDASGSITVALSQGGDYLGGVNRKYYWKMLSRKAMNSFFCRTDKPFKFFGTINEDVNTYTTLGNKGILMFSTTQASLVQKETQKNKGGMTETYIDGGTFLKSFYSVMAMPSCVKVDMMGSSRRRIHHKINWNCCVPLILNEKYRKT